MVDAYTYSHTSFQSCDFNPNVREKIGPGVKSCDGILMQLMRVLALLISSVVNREGAPVSLHLLPLLDLFLLLFTDSPKRPRSISVVRT